MGAVSLQNLSGFTLLESPTKVKNLAENAKKKGYSAIALTDINITYGLVDFYKAAKDTGIKPLLGMQLRINGLIDEANKYDLIVIAKDDQGYKNILRLSSAVNLLTENGEKENILTEILNRILLLESKNKEQDNEIYLLNCKTLGFQEVQVDLNTGQLVDPNTGLILDDISFCSHTELCDHDVDNMLKDIFK